MAFEHIRLEQSPAAVATITIARPDRLNALSGQTVDELRAAVEQARSSGARCVLLTGEGRGFSSGADLAGCSLALAADIVIAGRSAYFLQAFVNIGLIPDAGATWLLPRLAGRARAMEMMLLGERVPAEKALEWGLISRVVEDEHLASEAVMLATRLAQGPTVALGLIRKLAREAGHLPLSGALAAERVAQREAGETEDFKGAVVAFLQKRQPRFEGK
jgi:2-(1,2-epoxy-1,2-dihydrophenyl)acetyl-CoA isomerase